MAVDYGRALDLPLNSLIGASLVTQFVAGTALPWQVRAPEGSRPDA